MRDKTLYRQAQLLKPRFVAARSLIDESRLPAGTVAFTGEDANSEDGKSFEILVNLEKNPIELVTEEDAALGEVKACHIQVFHIVDGKVGLLAIVLGSPY